MKSNFSKFIILIEFILIAYLVYSLTKNVYQNYKVDQIIEAYQRDNRFMEEQIKNKTDEYLYVSSEEYIDKIAKQNLGYINPGEEVIVLSADVLAEGVGFEDDFSNSIGFAEVDIKQEWKKLFLKIDNGVINLLYCLRSLITRGGAVGSSSGS
jgi:cell division protein FtsB